MTAEQRRRELPGAIVKWYEIGRESKAACVVNGQGNSALIAEALEEKGLCVSRLPLAALDGMDGGNGDGVHGKEGQAAAYTDGRRGTGQERVSAEGANGNEGQVEENSEAYDVIAAVDVIEYAKNPAKVLKNIRKRLKPGGKLLLAADNRLGIRYFCGDQDAFSGKNYDGVENYTHLLPWEREEMKGRAYAKAELAGFLEEAGFKRRHFFSVFPRISNPQLLLAEDYVPNESLDIRIFPEYNNPDTVFLFEEELYPSLLANGLLHGMADGFWIECPLEEAPPSAYQVTLSGERGRENAMASILRRDGLVEKRALYEAGKVKLRHLMDNNEYLAAHGVRMIPAELKEDAFVMPYISGIPANDYFRELLQRDKKAFLAQLDIFWEIILNSSERADGTKVNWERFEPGWEKRKKDDPGREKWKRIAFGSEEEREELGVILKRGYLDLVSLNCFYCDGAFVFYDQELFLENVPAKAILLRTIEFIYKFNEQLDRILPRRELFERYGLIKHMDLFYQFIGIFLNILRDDDGLSDYFKEGRREAGVVLENRRRMNYSEEAYPLIFKDIFHHTIGRRLYLFGSGRYAKRFRERYREYPVSGYLDNDESRWGTEVDGLPVLPPAALREMNPAEYKVIVCVRNYGPIVKQLHRAGIPNFSVFDPNAVYDEVFSAMRRRGETWEKPAPARREGVLPVREAAVEGSRKYHVGYAAGVFDLFHIGHLNLLRRAKEQCDYLIVGVVTDEGVIRHKKSRPQIPFEERIAIVRACRYVDEAVEIPLNNGDTDEAFRRYRFDVQFSGSDYAEDPKWMAKKEFLQMHGADLVFFPYTEGISTTQLKDRVNAAGGEVNESMAARGEGE